MTTDAVGGVWTYALDLAFTLQSYGHQVYLACLGPAMSPAQQQTASALCAGLFTCELPLEWMPEVDETALDETGRWLLELAEEVGAEVVHLNQMSFGDLPWRAPVLTVGHSCVLSWWEAVKKEPAPPEWSYYADRVRRGLRGSDLVAAPSRAMLSSLRRLYGPFRHGVAILNGSKHPKPHSSTPKRPFTLLAGRLWDEAKNVALLRHLALVGKLDWPVLVAGDGGDTEGFDASDRFCQLGRLTPRELERYYRQASIYCLPARYEPFGLSALEAANHGCALVLSDLESLQEIWGEAALYVPPDRGDLLQECLNDLSQNPERLRLYGTRARLRAEQLDLVSMAAGYLELYRRLSTSSTPRHPKEVIIR